MEDKGRADARPFGLRASMKRMVWVCFAVYCLLACSEWLMGPIAGWVRGLGLLVVGFVALALHGRKRWGGWSPVLRLAFAAILVLGVPDVMARWAVSHLPGSLWTAVLAVVPAMMVLVVAQRSVSANGGDVRRLLVPALLGLGGVLLLIPVGLPHTVTGWFSFGVLVLSALLIAIASEAIYRMLRDFSAVQAVAIFCFANALVFLAAAVFTGGRGEGWNGTSWVTVLTSTVETVLLVVLLRSMEPLRLAARFLLVPLLTIVEGLTLLRPDLTVRMGVGVALLLGSTGALLFFRDVDNDGVMSLR